MFILFRFHINTIIKMKKDDFFLIKLGFAIGFPWIAITNVCSFLNISFENGFERLFSMFGVFGTLLVITWGILYPFKKVKRKQIKMLDFYDDTFFRFLFLFFLIEISVVFLGFKFF